MVERGNDHLGANCVVPAHLVERFWTIMHCGMPYVICDIDDQSFTHAEARVLIADRGKSRPMSAPADAARRRGRPPTKCSKHT